MSKLNLAMTLAAMTVLSMAERSSAQIFDLSWYTVDGGGGMSSTGGNFELSGTVGQPDAGVMSGGDFTLTGGFWAGAAPSADCQPVLQEARSVAVHKTGGGSTAEFYIDLDITNNPGSRTSEPRDSRLDVLDFVFDRALVSGSISVNGGAPEAMTLLDGGTRGRVTLSSPLANQAVYSIAVSGSAGAGCDSSQTICVVGLVGDFNNNGNVTASDKGEMLGFLFQPISQLNAKYDLQVNGSDSGVIEVSDLGAWTGFFGTGVVGQPCP